jgi:gliding motility-associated-like protein
LFIDVALQKFLRNIRGWKIKKQTEMRKNKGSFNKIAGMLVLCCGVFLLFPVTPYAQDFTYTSKPALTGVGNSSSIAFDADNDGQIDILVMGKTGTNYYTRLYHNNGDTTFLNLGIAFPGLAYGDADVTDYNNDGLQDIVLCGTDGTNKHFCLYKNKGDNLFSEVSVNIPGVDYSTVKCADLNCDGLTDIIIAGQSATQKIFRIFKNEGNDTFTEAVSLEGIYDGSFLVADINNDSYPDIIATGVNNPYELVNKIYVNQKNNFSFIERTSDIPAIRGGKISALDFNNDGYTDILVTGKTSDDEYISKIFRNNAGETFTLFASLKGLYYASSATCDFNSDGFPDIVLAGLDASSNYTTVYYVNNSGAGFTSQSTNLPNVIKGSISILDITDNDKPDILISGYTMSGPVTYMYNNSSTSANTRPAIPSNPLSFPDNDSVVLKWSRPQDTETSSKGLTYDVYIQTVSDSDTMFTVPASYPTGTRYVYKQGNLQDTFMVIKNLPYGKYAWSVQAIDQGYKGSAFAAQATFNICHNLHISNDTSICKGNNITLSAGSTSDVVNWYTSVNPSLPFHNGNAATVSVDQNQDIWAIVSTPIGCTLTDTIALSMLPLPETNLAGDTGLCAQTTLTLSLYQNDYKGDWSSKDESIDVPGTSTISFTVLYDNTVYVKITDTNGCNSYDTTNITAYPLPESYLSSDTSACLHSTVQLNAGTAPDNVFWSDSNGQQLSDQNSLEYFVENPEKLSVKITNTLNCTSFDTISIAMLPLPVANAGQDILICPGGTAKLGGTAQTGLLYEWAPASSLDDNHIAQPVASPEITTEYILKIADPNLCINYDSVVVTINPPGIINTGGDKSICLGNSVILGGTPTASGSLLPYSYQWYPANGLNNSNLANPTASPDSTTQYALVVSTGSCIVDTVSVKVTVLPLPAITISGNVVIGYQESTRLQATGGTQYKWEPESGLDDPASPTPTASPEATTTYTVWVTDTNSCQSEAQVTVTIQNEIFVPSLFTPNGDGKNDAFKIYGTGIGAVHLRIYNPEGILVYETAGMEEATQTGWDGTYHGKPLSAGKYLWIIEATSASGTELMYNGSNKGIVTLLR